MIGVRAGATPIDKTFLRSEEFSDLLEEIIVRVSRTKSEAKRARFRHVLVAAFQGQREADFAQLFLGILSDISDQEMIVLGKVISYVHDRSGREPQAQKMGPLSYEEPGWDLEPRNARQIVQSLVARGLLTDDSHGYFVIRDGKGLVPRQAYEVISPTDLGERFLSWLNEP